VVILNNDTVADQKYHEINIIIDGKEKTLELGKKRYKSKEHISIIEIKETNINFINFIELDDKLYEEEAEMFYYKESIYSIQLDNKKETLFSYGMLKEIYNKKIIYSCNLNKNYKFSLIFNLSNNKLIGMNQNIYNNYNTGIFFKYVINELFLDNYYEEYNDNKVIIHTNCHENLIDSNLPCFEEIHKKKFVEKNNIIDILINIDQKDINKEIYFLDDKYFNFKNNKFIYCRNNLKELNQTNTELYINNIKYEYKKYFIPEKVGKYNIKLKFKINLTDCSFMFVGCENIIKINLSSFNTK